ncbi:MAG: hypothetical protein NG737_06005 [Omnitrophica bacterium]|nr:hypothetical protein [Candidatus Omnitrophota bacterium]
MATIRQYICKRCPPSNAGNLFDALLKKAHGESVKCRRCDTPYESLRLKFDFGLGATNSECTALDCFTPGKIQQWRDEKNSKVCFYPFLVILKRHGKANAIWLPYWHLVTKGKKFIKKYGQWAPFMDSYLFQDLLQQAKKKGY